MMILLINGTEHQVEVDPEMPLLWVIRDVLGMTGTKFGCGMALCGACTVHMDGFPVPSCQMPAAAAEGAAITTIEGLSGHVAEAIQAAWVDLDVPQCGYCQSGQVLAAVALLRDNRQPSDGDIDAAMSGNICRCATYHRIRAAIHDAAGRLES